MFAGVMEADTTTPFLIQDTNDGKVKATTGT